MSRKKGNFVEEHVEKMVLGVVGLICLWLLFGHVLLSPNKVTYKGHKYGPADIDKAIYKQAEVLERELLGPAEQKEPYKPRLDEFATLFGSPVNIEATVVPLRPAYVSDDGPQKKQYRLPKIGVVDQVAAEHIRAAVYVPTAMVDGEREYSQNDSEPNDMDIVTVEATINITQLYETFYDSFLGVDVPQQWRDPCLAMPVFAPVHLQRQQQLADGSWSDWQDVSRTRIEHRGEMFEALRAIEKPSAAEVKMQLYKFDDPEVRVDILQPEPYVVASAEEQWFPPTLHKKYLEAHRQAQARERRKVIEEEKENDDRRRDRSRSGGGRAGYSERDRSGYGTRSRAPYSGRGPGMRDRRPFTSSRRDETERSSLKKLKSRKSSETEWLDELNEELGKIVITAKTDLSKMSEPLLFWAHDDTVEPGGSYQYRIRFGVLNPLAGTNQISKPSQGARYQIIQWSQFSEVTDVVEIPETIYFFPLQVQQAVKKVTVKVCRYMLGYWYSRSFPVQQGEVVGKVVDYDPSEDEKTQSEGDLTLPETIDYSTKAVLVDVATVNGWSGERNLSLGYYHDMLYTLDGSEIEHMPIVRASWSKDIQGMFRQLETWEKRPKKPFQAWSSTADRLNRRGRMRRKVDVGDMEEEEEDWREMEELEAYRRMTGER